MLKKLAKIAASLKLAKFNLFFLGLSFKLQALLYMMIRLRYRESWKSLTKF